MINRKKLHILLCAIKNFYRFAPRHFLIILMLMLLQGLTAGIGLLMILPLLQLVGFEIGRETDSGIVLTGVTQVFHSLGLTLSLETVLISYVILIGIIASLRYQLSVMTIRIQQRYICHLRNQLYRDLLHSSWQFIIRNKMSDFTHSLTAQVQGIGLATQQMLNLLSQLVLTVVMVFLAFLLSWQMSLLAMAFATCLLVLIMPLNHIIYGSGKTQLIGFKAVFQLVTEQLASLKMIKSYGSEDHHVALLQQSGELLETQNLRLSRINALTQWVFVVGGAIAFSLFVYFSQTKFDIDLATVFLLLIIFSRLLPQVSGIQKTWQQLLHRLPSFEDVEQMSRSCHQAKEIIPNQRQPKLNLQQQISLQNISYQYPGHAHQILHDFSVIIEHNQTVALTGPSGAGKTTLADLIAGLLVPTSGHIYCDDTRLEAKTRIPWRQSLAYVTQEVYLFHDTVGANLSWVAPDLQEQELWDALKLAAADKFVAALPQGLNTLIGDRGIRLSGGERQRLALARALLTKPQLLILDEATSALDHANEMKIQQALQKLHGKLTILIIAHRETTIAHADKTIELGPEPLVIHETHNQAEKILESI